MNKLRITFEYIIYKITARHKKGYGIHSPFLYNFIREVLNSKYEDEQIGEIEKIKNHLYKSDEKIKVYDLGAGSKGKNKTYRKVKDIARNSAVKKKYGRLLYKIAEFFKTKQILELGTSFGLGTMYLAAYEDSEVITVEGCPESARIARSNFQLLKKENIIQKIGNLDEVLTEIINDLDRLDLVYFDANHQKAASLNYFNICMSKVHNDTIFIFDDIRWSRGMKEAWREIKNNDKVSLTVDLFFVGIVFFKSELSKENFVINY